MRTILHTTFGSLFLITAVAGQSQNEGKEKPEVHPLNHPALQLLESTYASGNGIVSPAQEPWEEGFLNVALWNQLPKGSWRIESKTDTVTKYIAEEVQAFLGGPARQVKLRTDTQTGKILRIDVIWSEIALSVGEATVNIRDAETGRKDRKAEREREKNRAGQFENGRVYREAVVAANKHMGKELSARFGKPKSKQLGANQRLTAGGMVDEFTTKTGTTIRFFGEEKYMCMAIIIPANAEDRDRRIPTYEEERFKDTKPEDWAQQNVERRPNGDVLIKNVPMIEQGPRGYCTIATGAMVLDYWGSPVPLEVIAQCQTVSWLGDTINAMHFKDVVELVAKEASLKTEFTDKQRPLRFNQVIDEIDAGRPICFGRFVTQERIALHRAWRDEVEKNPNFKIPEEDRDARKKWPNSLNDTHTSIITGYNKEQKVIMLTESWGEGNRYFRMSWDEAIASLNFMQTFRPSK